jgi:hypothetical protein
VPGPCRRGSACPCCSCTSRTPRPRSNRQQTANRKQRDKLQLVKRSVNATHSSQVWRDNGVSQRGAGTHNASVLTRVFSPSHSGGGDGVGRGVGRGVGAGVGLQPAASPIQTPPGHVLKPTRAGSVSP